MGISTKWDNLDKTIYRWTFEGTWTWEDYYTQRAIANPEIASVDHKVDLIIDLSNSNMLPSGAMAHTRSAIAQSPTNIGVSVVVGVHSIFKVFLNIWQSMTGFLGKNRPALYLVATEKEAYALIEKQRQQQP